MISFERHGRGVRLVLVHGITESLRSWGSPGRAVSGHARGAGRGHLCGHGSSAAHAPYDVLTLAGDVHEVLSAYVALFPACGALAIDQSLRLGAFQESLRALEPMLRGDQVRFDDAMTMVFESLRGPLDDEQWRRLTVLRRLDQDVVLVIWSSVFDLAPDELDTMVDAMTRAIGVPFLAVHGTDPGEDYEQWLDDRVATARVERWPDRGHYPHLAEPDRFLATLDDFERSLPRAVVRVAAGEVSRRSALASVA